MKPILLFALSLVFFKSVYAQQYTVNGNASQTNCHCYTLTPNLLTQSGSVWNNNKIDLTNSFTFVFNVNLGCTDGNGADGIAFVLQPISTSVGGNGSGLGFGGISPSIGVTLDTYQNSTPDNDPFYDHIGIQRNGNLIHTSVENLAGPIAASSINNNIEDCADHELKISWDASTKNLSVFFDAVARVNVINDLVATTFGGNPLVFWGFTGSTGGLSNLQKFCTTLNPQWNFSATQKRCVNEPITFYDATISFAPPAKIYWSFGDGSNIDSVNLNPTHTYLVPGLYVVKQRVKGIDGCEEINTQDVRIGSKPVAGFRFTDSCVLQTAHFFDTSRVTVGTINSIYWNLDNGGITSTSFTPTTVFNTPGIKQIKLIVKTLEGCESDTLFKPIRIRDRPVADFGFTDSVCLGSTITFTDNSTLSDGPVNGWIWLMDGTDILNNAAVANHTFLTAGNHTASLSSTGTGDGACLSNIKTKNVFIADKPRAGIKALIACRSQQVQLQDSSYTTDGLSITGWWWDLGNGQFSVLQNLLVTYTTGGTVIIRHVVYNARNCKSDTLIRTITVNEKPVVKFGIAEILCDNPNVRFFDSSIAGAGVVNQWQWINNNTIFSTQQNPVNGFPAGLNTVGLSVTSSLGCKSDTLYKTFLMKTKPGISMFFKDTCKFAAVKFSATETPTNIGINEWHWQFGDGNSVTGNPVTHIYNQNGSYRVKLFAISSEGCSSDTLDENINIYGTNAFAGNDTIIAAGQPIRLNASGGLSYTWSPSTGLSNVNVPDPLVNIQATQSYQLKAFTPEGCESYDSITVKVYKGPDIYLPTAFTPNGDGLNDVFRGTLIGIKTFQYMRVYNRWGQEIFSTGDYLKGWDGNWKGQQQGNGVFVVIAAGIDFRGKMITKKSTVMLIR